MQTDPIIEGRSLLVFDFETTSNKPHSTGVVQLAATLGGEVLFNEICNPGISISEEAQGVHGISQEMVEGKPSDKERVGELARVILEHKDRIYLAGHNHTGFDIPILWRIAGIENPPKIPTIDTLVAAVRTHPMAPNHKLSDFCQFVGVHDGQGAHDALTDIRMVEQLIEFFIRGLEFSGYAQLSEWLATPRVHAICTLKKHKGKFWGRGEGKVPYFYAKWIADNFDNVTADLAATLKHHYGITCKGAIV